MLRETTYYQIAQWVEAEEMDLLKEKVTTYYQRYTFLQEERKFKEMYFFAQLADPIIAFESNQEEDGLAAFTEVKPHLNHLNDGSEERQKLLGNLFGAISSYYVRVMDYEEAEHWINEGLLLVPESKELLRKKALLNE